MTLPIILYDNILDKGGALTADTTAAGHDVLNLKDLRPYLKWKAADTVSPVSISIDLGASITADADSVCILGHNLNTVGASVTIQWSVDAVWTSPQTVISFVPPNDKTILKEFAAPGVKRYWRVQITGALTAAPEIAILMFGIKLQFPYPPDRPFAPFVKAINGTAVRNSTGQILGAVVEYKPVKITARFSNLSRTFVYSMYQNFWDLHAGLLKPFFFAWDIGTFPDHVFFVKVPDSAAFEAPLSILSVADSITLEMEGVAE